MMEFTALFQAAWAASPIGVIFAILFALSSIFGSLKTGYFGLRWIAWPVIWSIGWVFSRPVVAIRNVRAARRLLEADLNLHAALSADYSRQIEYVLADVKRYANAFYSERNPMYSDSETVTHPSLQELEKTARELQHKIARAYEVACSTAVTPEGMDARNENIRKALTNAS